MAPFDRPCFHHIKNTIRFCFLQNKTCYKSRSQLKLSSLHIQLDQAVSIIKDANYIAIP